MKILNLIKTLLGADFFSELVSRLKSESPAFFKKLQAIIGIIIIAIAGLHMAVAAGYLPTWQPYMDAIDSISLLLAGAFGVSFLAKKDPPTDKQTEK